MDGPSLTQQLRELAELHGSGVIDADEFQSAKARLLGSDLHTPPQTVPRPPVDVRQPVDFRAPAAELAGSSRSRTADSFTGLWLIVGGVVLVVAMLVGLLIVALPGAFDVGGKDPCTVLDPEDRTALALANSGTAGGAADRRQCSWENAGDDSDTRMVFGDSSTKPDSARYEPVLTLFTVNYEVEASLVLQAGSTRVADLPATVYQIRDAVEGHMGCVVVVATANDETVAVLDTDNAGDDVPISVLCDHAQKVMATTVTNLSG
ncbi:MAG: DUF3558 family protein [Pseudonocardia sp.]|nr:DUF3558 family protein [Pseudonocardia sp.]